MSPSQSAAAENPSSPSPIPSPSSVPTSSLFLPPKGPAAPLPSPSPSSSIEDSPSPSPDDAGAEPIWSDDSAVEAAPTDRPSDSSGTPSTGKGPALSKSGLRLVVGQAVKTVTGAVSAIAATATEREFGVWQADPEDVEGIAHPATRIIWRRLPDDAKGSDVVDLLGLALSLAAYVGKNFVRRAEIRGAIERGEITVAAPAEPVS